MLQKLRESKDYLLKERAELEAKIREELKLERAAPNKHHASQAHRNRISYEKRLKEVNGIIENIRQQIKALNSASKKACQLQTQIYAEEVSFLIDGTDLDV